MTVFVALLRAVNVGGRKLLMSDLQGIAAELGFERARTYIASGNLLLATDLGERRIKAMLEARLEEHMRATVSVIVRTGPELEGVVAGNPFTGDPATASLRSSSTPRRLRMRWRMPAILPTNASPSATAKSMSRTAKTVWRDRGCGFPAPRRAPPAT